jgi:hypothetical protein
LGEALKDFIINGQTYRFDKILYWIFIIIILGFSLYAVFISQGKLYAYSECPSNIVNGIELGGKCINTFFNSNLCTDNIISGDICTTEFLNAGMSIGEKPSIFIANFYWIILSIIIIWLILNHFLFNKTFRFGGDNNG